MDFWFQLVTTIVCSVLASSGLWAYLTKRMDRKDAKTDLLLGIAHEKILSLGMSYIERGYITRDEYENLHTYLYEPYRRVMKDGDTSAADRMIKEVDKLPIKTIDMVTTAHHE